MFSWSYSGLYIREVRLRITLRDFLRNFHGNRVPLVEEVGVVVFVDRERHIFLCNFGQILRVSPARRPFDENLSLACSIKVIKPTHLGKIVGLVRVVNSRLDGDSGGVFGG